MADILPWHREAWAGLAARAGEERLPHALLLTGPDGVGKERFAMEFARFLLCSAPHAGAPCGGCRGCRLFDAGTHPDYHRLGLVDDARVIKVDQVRELGAALGMTAQERGRKVALIAPADRMNASAANALLKTLEEPPGDAVLLLVSARAAALPATIRSRCQRVTLQAPSRETALAWWGEAGHGAGAAKGAIAAGVPPLRVEAWQAEGLLELRAGLWKEWLAVAGGRAEPVAAAEAWAKRLALPQALAWLQEAVALAARVKARGAEGEPETAQLPDLQRWVQRIHWDALFELDAELLQAARAAGTALNAQMVLESIALRSAAMNPGRERVRHG